MRIRFLSDQIYETTGPGKGPHFKAGQELAADDVASVLGVPRCTPEYSEGFLQRWINRRTAVLVTDQADFADETSGASSEVKTLDEMTRVELDDLAKTLELDTSSARNKAEVVSLIKAKQVEIQSADQLGTSE